LTTTRGRTSSARNDASPVRLFWHNRLDSDAILCEYSKHERGNDQVWPKRSRMAVGETRVWPAAADVLVVCDRVRGSVLGGVPTPDASRFGYPQFFVERDYIHDVPITWNVNIAALLWNILCWVSVFAMIGLVAYVARRRDDGWSKSSAIAYRYLAVVLALMLIYRPINWGCLMIAERVFSTGILTDYYISLEKLIGPGIWIQSIVLWTLVIVLTSGIVRRLHIVLPLVARWISVVVFLSLICFFAEAVEFKWGYDLGASTLFALRGILEAKWYFAWCLVPIFLIDCLATFLWGRMRQRKAAGSVP
jgi:hypothetical protein